MKEIESYHDFITLPINQYQKEEHTYKTIDTYPTDDYDTEGMYVEDDCQ